MFGRFGHRLIAAAGFSSIAAAVWAGSGYLPNAGPLPMRFRALPLLTTNWVSAPAPVPADSGDMTVDDEDVSNALQPLLIPPLAGTNASGSNAEIMEVSSAPVAPPIPEPVISPQMLIQYFRPSSNAVTAGPADSVGFLLPPPGAAPPGASAPAPKTARPTNP